MTDPTVEMRDPTTVDLLAALHRHRLTQSLDRLACGGTAVEAYSRMSEAAGRELVGGGGAHDQCVGALVDAYNSDDAEAMRLALKTLCAELKNTGSQPAPTEMPWFGEFHRLWRNKVSRGVVVPPGAPP
jgi:hypothetical protein